MILLTSMAVDGDRWMGCHSTNFWQLESLDGPFTFSRLIPTQLAMTLLWLLIEPLYPNYHPLDHV
jgi:hypothetical protein